MIEVKQITKRFDNVRAVNGVSFTAPNGVITGLLGSNGAGKTTTLRIIAGAMQPDSGMACVDSRSGREAQGRLGALLDHTGIYPRLSVRENLLYYARLRGYSGSDAQDRVDEAIARLGLESIADRKTAGFSQGEHMRTALARALVHSPRNLILDEPTNGLDVTSLRSLRSFLRELRDEGCCILFSSHIFQDVSGLCDRVVVIANGALLAEGPPSDLQAKTGTPNLEEAFIRMLENQEVTKC